MALLERWRYRSVWADPARKLRTLESFAETEEDGGKDLAKAVKRDYRTANLSETDAGMLDFVAKLTRSPASVEQSDVETLRQLGFDDGSIHDVVQVTALFAYFLFGETLGPVALAGMAVAMAGVALVNRA